MGFYGVRSHGQKTVNNFGGFVMFDPLVRRLHVRLLGGGVQLLGILKMIRYLEIKKGEYAR